MNSLRLEKPIACTENAPDDPIIRRRKERIAWWAERGVHDIDLEDQLPDSLMSELANVLHSAKGNARTRGLPFEITRGLVSKLYLLQNGCCSLSGIRFSFEKHGDAYKRPFAPSIDRIDNSKGYTRDNVRLVCVVVNLAMNQWGLGLLTEVARGIVRHAKP